VVVFVVDPHNVTSVVALAAFVTLWGLWTFNVTSGGSGVAVVTLWGFPPLVIHANHHWGGQRGWLPVCATGVPR
jgi:hypothetical protein